MKLNSSRTIFATTNLEHFRQHAKPIASAKSLGEAKAMVRQVANDKGPLILAHLPKTDGRDNAAQVKMLRQAGCKRIFEEPNRSSPLAVRVNHVGLAILRVPVGRGPNALHYVSRTGGSNLLA
jgi:hypothetical protein